jgi:hypothetical protein
LLEAVSRVSPLFAADARLVVLVLETARSRHREAERDVIWCGALRRLGSRLSCDEKKKVPATGTNVFKVSSSKSCAR